MWGVICQINWTIGKLMTKLKCAIFMCVHIHTFIIIINYKNVGVCKHSNFRYHLHQLIVDDTKLANLLEAFP